MFNDFRIDNTAVHEWLPWGGIVCPFVMRQKDGSFFSVIRYDEYDKSKMPPILNRDFKRGWSLWSETQYDTKSGFTHYLAVAWNPFIPKYGEFVTNTLRDKVSKDKILDIFAVEMERLIEDICAVTKAELLTYQDFMDFLSFTMSFGEDYVDMPEVPLYMDVLLSQNLKINFGRNEVVINDKKILIVSLPGRPNVKEMFAAALVNVPWRYSQRMLLFDEESAKKDLEKYTAKWSEGRKVNKRYVLRDIIGNINGYYSGNLLFLPSDKDYEPLKEYVENICIEEKVPYIVEEYNTKDIWWGSLPGIFRANVIPPLVGIESLDDILWNTGATETDENNTLAEMMTKIGEKTDDSATGLHVLVKDNREEEENV